MTIFRKTAHIQTVADSVTTIGNYAAVPVGNLVLNGDFVSPLDGTVDFTSRNYATSVTIGSVGDISAASFTITGFYNGKQIVETITGPVGPANRVHTNLLFDEVIKIRANVAATINQAFTIGSNFRIAVVLADGNSRMADRHPNYVFNTLLSSVTAVAPWAVGAAVVYGVAQREPGLLAADKLAVGVGRDPSYFPLHDVTVGITQAELLSGLQFEVVGYPYSAIIAYLNNGVNTTPVFIEIAQS